MALTMQEIQQKAAVDGAFRASLLAEPKATLASVGLEVPEGITVDVIEAGYNRLPIVLPPVQRGELSDDALATMVGGAAQVAAGSAFITSFIGT
ncbi:MAG TPA: NHLP leader peptide family RiPP precursor [Acidimicrobiales bacterium]|nr:NHLP leader peptide family RiPP precursor [Acidimicrobiales bacterium]